MPGISFPAEPPATPHLICCDGYYVHPTRPACVEGYTALPLARVLAAFEGRPLARAEAVASLTQGQRLALFRRACPVCPRDHHKAAENLARAWGQLAPGAREAAAELGTADLLRLVRVQGRTPEETATLQILAAAAARLKRATRR